MKVKIKKYSLHITQYNKKNHITQYNKTNHVYGTCRISY